MAAVGEGFAPDEQQEAREGGRDHGATEPDRDRTELGYRQAGRGEGPTEGDYGQEAEEQAVRFRRQGSNVIACSHEQE